jgi:hypothetical protein
MENKTSLNVSKHSYVRDVLLWKTHWNHVPTPFGKHPFAETISAERSFQQTLCRVYLSLGNLSISRSD